MQPANSTLRQCSHSRQITRRCSRRHSSNRTRAFCSCHGWNMWSNRRLNGRWHMNSKQPLYRLKSSTAIEPLVNKWVAWSHVLAPVVSSMHLRNYQIELLRSFIDNPEAHVDACKVPRLRTGRVVDLPIERVDEVKDFLVNTEAEQADNLRFAENAIAFHNQLASEADGHSLDSYYSKLPPELRGYVELLYDYYDHPIMRFFEGMLYRSGYYKKHLQS